MYVKSYNVSYATNTMSLEVALERLKRCNRYDYHNVQYLLHCVYYISIIILLYFYYIHVMCHIIRK